MAKKRAQKRQQATGDIRSADYRHTGEKRTNIPPAAMAAEGQIPRVPKVRYHYSPHLPPELRFDPSGKSDQFPELIAAAGRRPLTEKEQKRLADALNSHQPWLEWSAKREQHQRGLLEVDPVALHIHERVSTQAMLQVLRREDVQRGLFADPQQSYSEAVQFYKHDVDWANRLILGDSLHVMASLARREHLAGKVQMIYVDPPYGIRFASNFQPEVGQRDIKDRDSDLTREAETVRAYRDTWTLGVHSYLSYLRDRFLLAKVLLANSGSIFVQISDENSHRVRMLMDEIFGADNMLAQVAFKKTGGFETTGLPGICDYLLWYSKDKSQAKVIGLFDSKVHGEGSGDRYNSVLLQDGSVVPASRFESDEGIQLPEGARLFLGGPLTSDGAAKSPKPFEFEGNTFLPKPNQHWKIEGLERAARAERIFRTRSFVNSRLFLDDFAATPVTNMWTDTMGTAEREKVYSVQTATKVVDRCLLMTTDPGDLVFDPTCGSGTTAYVAEQRGRRWITCDTSRVALTLARQRLITSRFPYYELRPIDDRDRQRNPQGPWLSDAAGKISGKATFKCETLPHIKLGDVAQNTSLDPIFEKHEPILAAALKALNASIKTISEETRRKLQAKLIEKQKRDGKRAITEADRRRWILPKNEWQHWEVPFDTDSDWSEPLKSALVAYRGAWRLKMDEVNDCIAANANPEELVDRPVTTGGVVRVTGPFTVEGVRPEELSLGKDGLFDPTPNEFDLEGGSSDADGIEQNIHPYFAQMLQHLKADGVTFLGNQRKKFGQLEGLFEDASGSLIHAEGAWEGADSDGQNSVAISFGPQHGPVTALQVEEAIRAAKRYGELVIAGFSFDAESYAVVEAQAHPKLRIHIAQIRPDLNEAMAGLLKDTPNSQLFTVFGQPEVEVVETKDGWICTLKGVDIYNPVENTVRSSGADKVAAWFLDSDFDGRCFCITQAFFPDQNSWDKIAKALGSTADPEAFAALKGTVSLPFPKGKFGRIAVKVIDPRGNEVMAVRKLS